MSITLKMVDFQMATAALQKAMNEFRGGKFVTVGIHEGAPDVEGSEMNMATLGALLNFGSDGQKIPARPWLAPGVESGSRDYIDAVRSSVGAGADLDMALEQVGALAAGAVQQFMTDLKSPPNAPSTIKAKGSSNPLIDTGALRQSVTYQTTIEKPSEGI